jgi:SpoIID/LytB domain protein
MNSKMTIKVGIMEDAEKVFFRITSTGYKVYVGHKKSPHFVIHDTQTHKLLPEGEHITLVVKNKTYRLKSAKINLVPLNEDSMFVIYNVAVGRKFHWQHLEKQFFPQEIVVKNVNGKLMLINNVELENYITSVISSEMSSSAPPEYLKMHAVVSRSWVLAQIQNKRKNKFRQASSYSYEDENTIIRWYGREGHTEYDVCNDDHCQRYHGFSRNKFTEAASSAVKATSGEVLTYEGELCDTRFSKACGGKTEKYENVWEDGCKIPYLTSVWDAGGKLFFGALSSENNATKWIHSSPKVYCNIKEPSTLKNFLVDFDFSATGYSFFRWKVKYAREELEEIIKQKTGRNIGKLLDIIPLKRGSSGRLIYIEIVGDKKRIKIGKELEIRRVLSPSHLYSSCFIVKKRKDAFTFYGSGWGHGVGLCQIGAASMVLSGKNYKEVLQHYFPHTEISKIY